MQSLIIGIVFIIVAIFIFILATYKPCHNNKYVQMIKEHQLYSNTLPYIIAAGLFTVGLVFISKYYKISKHVIHAKSNFTGGDIDIDGMDDNLPSTNIAQFLE